MKKISILTGITILILASLGCQSKPHPTVASQSYVKQYGDITIKVHYMSYDELVAEHGSRGNPFIDYPSILTQKDLLTFRLEITTGETSLEIVQKDINFTLGEVSADPVSEHILITLWDPYSESGSDRTRKFSTIRRYVSKGTLKATPEEPLDTYLVFAKKFPQTGKALLSLPISTDSGDYGIIDIDFLFTGESDLELDEEGNVKNTGIFSE